VVYNWYNLIKPKKASIRHSDAEKRGRKLGGFPFLFS
jgi:hypothetical protein